MNHPSSRTEAKALGAKYYYTGKPCKHGHISLRETKGTCMECRTEQTRKDNERRKLLPKSVAAKEAGRRYYEKNKDLVKARANNQTVEKRRQYRAKWAKENKEAVQAFNNAWKRRAREACPSWLTREQKKQINDLYLTARKLTAATGEKYVVDHIVPLRSDVVCGLHVPWNLRVITHEENCRKSNRWDVSSHLGVDGV